MDTFVVKYGDAYLKFGSYRRATCVDNPLKASLYSNEKLAKKRLHDQIYHNRVIIPTNQLRIVKITMKIDSEITV